MKTIEKKYLTPNDVGKLLMVSPITVRQWAQKGELPSLATPGGHRRFLREDLIRFAKRRGLSLALPGSDEPRILVVDDDEPFAAYLLDLFAVLDKPVVTDIAHDGFEAGRKVQTFQPHIVLLDLMMPGINGFEVCRSLKEDPSTSATRVIAMTGYSSSENRARILAAGAEQCLAKPFDRTTLLDAIGFSAHEQEVASPK